MFWTGFWIGFAAAAFLALIVWVFVAGLRSLRADDAMITAHKAEQQKGDR